MFRELLICSKALGASEPESCVLVASHIEVSRCAFKGTRKYPKLMSISHETTGIEVTGRASG